MCHGVRGLDRRWFAVRAGGRGEFFALLWVCCSALGASSLSYAQSLPAARPATQRAAAAEFTIPLPLDMEDLEPKVRRAMEEAIVAVRAEPGSDVAVGRLGILYHANLLPELAVLCYRRARELAPGKPQWRYLLAVVARHTGDAATAREELAALRDAKVDYPPVLYHLGEISLDAGEIDQAATLFEEMIAAAPQAAGGYFGLGRVEVQRGNYRLASELLTRAKERAPASQDVLQQLGLVYRRRALIEKDPTLRVKARELLLAAREGREVLLYEDPWRSPIRRVEVSPAQLSEQAHALVQAGRFDEAAAIMEEVVRRQPNVVSFLKHLVSIRARQGRKLETRELCERITRLAPSDAEAWEVLAEIHLETGDREGALAAANRARLLGPHRTHTHYLRGRILLEDGKPAEALEDLRAVLARQPSHAQAMVRLADALLRLRRNEEALPLARRAVELDEDNAYARFELGVALARAGDFEGSQQQLRKALELKPKSRAARIFLDWVEQQSAAARSPQPTTSVAPK